MFYDSTYMIFTIIGIALVFIPQMLVKSTFSKFKNVKANKGITGAQVAKNLLAEAGIFDVQVTSTHGELSDHYDPSQKVVRLSETVFSGNSIAAYGIAAHEVGHAIQDNSGYIPMKLRAGILPAVQVGQTLGPLLLMGGLGLRYFLQAEGGLANLVALTGIIFYGAVVIFHIITLPVEINASMRAMRSLSDGGYLETTELGGTKSVLSAAAMTYIATALYALMELVYWIWVYFGRRD